MNHIHIATRGASDWRSRLGDPEKHWKREASAMETAVSWELAAREASGLPKPIANILNADKLKNPELLLAVSEHKVPLKGMGGASQCDVWALVKTNAGIVSLSVEAKAKEPFGDGNESLSSWLESGKSNGSRENREKRWKNVRNNLPLGDYDEVPFQILHRCAAGVIEARRFGLRNAVFLVQSFKAPAKSFEKYAIFAEALGLPAEKGHLHFSTVGEGENTVKLGVGWVDCLFASDSQMAKVL